MTHRGKVAFARCFGLLAALVLVTAPLAAQQTSGKIEGTVTDQAGVPIANAQVLIVGTSYGAVTNDKGYYFFNNVPVGNYTVRAQFIGYAPAELRGVRVLSGQTVTANVKMESSAVQVTGVTITAAANPLVPRDQVTSKTTISGDLVDGLPVDNMRDVIAFTPGVVESGDNDGLSIRGGRPGEANVYIDGAPVRGVNSGSQRIQLGTNAVEEASVTIGAIGVEFSDAQSGVISFTTRAGGELFSGSLSVETDEMFGDAVSLGQNRFEGSIGGPVPAVPNLRFFLSGTAQGELSAARGAGSEDVPRFVVGGVDQVVPTPDANGNIQDVTLPQFVQHSGTCGNFGSSANPAAQAIQDNYGFECQGRRFPMDWDSFLQFQGNLQYTYGSGSSVRLTGLANGRQTRNTPGTFIAAPSLYSGTHLSNRLAVLNWSHQVARSAERALNINVNLSWGSDQSIAGPLSTQSDIDTRSPTLGIVPGALEFAGFDGFPVPIGDDIVRNVRSNQGLRTPLLNRTDLNNVQGFRLNPYGMQAGAWYTSGLNIIGTTLAETRYTGRLIVDWQANRYHRFKLGGDFKQTDLAYWSSSLITQFTMDVYKVDPVQYGLFVADRLDLGDVVLELGARWDSYNSNSLFATTPGRISTHPDWNPNAATDDAVYAAMLADRDIFTPAETHSTISPRLGVSFPITDKTGFHLSYAQQVQTPEFTTMLSGVNNDLSFTNTNDIFGRDLDFGKTVIFEFGVRHAFSQDLVLGIAAYNKDKVSDYAARILPYVDPRNPSDTLNVNVLTNRDFGNSRGAELKLDWRLGTFVNATLGYTFQISKNTGSDPFSYLNTFARQVSGVTGDRTPPPEAANRTNDDRTHNIGGAVSVAFPADYRKGTVGGSILQNIGLAVSGRVQSGLAYTRMVNDGAGQTAPRLAFGLGGRAAEPLNASSLPWVKLVNMRITKAIKVGPSDWTLFADARNVLNLRNIVSLFAETGDVVNADHRTKTLTAEYEGLADEAGLAGVLNADGSIDLAPSCAGWSRPVNCESLRRVEARFGNGDREYTPAEQDRALNTYYEAHFGTYRFYDQPRHIRLGLELSF